MNKEVVRQTSPIILAIGLLWYVLKDVPMAELIIQFRRANYWWLALAGLLISLYYTHRNTNYINR